MLLCGASVAAGGAAGGGTAGKGPQNGKIPGGKPGNIPGTMEEKSVINCPLWHWTPDIMTDCWLLHSLDFGFFFFPWLVKKKKKPFLYMWPVCTKHLWTWHTWQRAQHSTFPFISGQRVCQQAAFSMDVQLIGGFHPSDSLGFYTELSPCVLSLLPTVLPLVDTWPLIVLWYHKNWTLNPLTFPFNGLYRNLSQVPPGQSHTAGVTSSLQG